VRVFLGIELRDRFTAIIIVIINLEGTLVKKKTEIISDQFINTICKRLSENKQVRRTLPLWGRVHIDRQLPFLCIYRNLQQDDNAMSERLIMGEASYLIATGNRRQQKQLAVLVKSIVNTLKDKFGTFLIVEVWTTPEDNKEKELVDNYRPEFKIIKPTKTSILSTIDTLEKSLKSIKIRRLASEVSTINSFRIAPKNFPPILSLSDAKKLGCHIIGIEVKPIYQNVETEQFFPLIRRDVARGLTRALNNSFFDFSHTHTPYRPKHYHTLGRLSMVKAVWEVDQQLAEINNGFDFLLQVTPINSKTAWSAFERNHYKKQPNFIYRPLPLDPALSKRQLFQVPIEKIEDPTLSLLFRQQQMELDRKLSMLMDRDTNRFLYGSLQLYGAIDNSLLKIVTEILEQFPPRSRDEFSKNKINATTFATRANKELSFYQNVISDHCCKTFIREDITGLMVSQGNLLIGSQTKIAEHRIEALIQHEVGTHILTYINGKAQPFKQLYIGLSGYEELQEGLAVLSEYLVGGLTRRRLRLLAARVIAGHYLVDGASFVEVFHELNHNFGFERHTAFNISTRIFRSGGFTKDIVYLRGLIQLLDYLKNGGELEPLYVGKISLEHLAIIKELQWRKVLVSPPLRPSYFNNPKTTNKLNDLRKGLSPINLIERSK
jgi:uncharacterized protein (TIGR02421 family)